MGGFFLKSALDNICKALDTINDRTGMIFSLLFFPGWFLVLYSVVVRYFFNAPSYWAGDLAKFVFAVYFMVGGAYCLTNNSHIRVDVIYNLLSYQKRRLIELLVVFPLLFAFAFPLIWHGSIFAWKSLKYMELSPPPTNLPVFPVKIAIPIAGALFLLQALADLYRFCFDKKPEEGSR
jgi:TRAP-type mannitol/chloroaromatic compound transport system permease small subunit